MDVQACLSLHCGSKIHWSLFRKGEEAISMNLGSLPSVQEALALGINNLSCKSSIAGSMVHSSSLSAEALRYGSYLLMNY